MLRFLVERGGDATVIDYRHDWGLRGQQPTRRLVIHYLLLSLHRNAPEFYRTWRSGELYHALKECVKTFLNHGADANALNGKGASILEYALGRKFCPEDLSPS